MNNTLYFLITSNLIVNCLFLTSIFKLRNIKSEFNIRLEILLTFLVWFVTTQLAIGLYIHQEEGSPNFDWIYLILVARSIAASILTCARPLWLTQKGNQLRKEFILLPPNQDSVENLDMVLQIPIATEYFYNFLDRQQASTVSNTSSGGNVSGESAVTYFFSLYVDLRQFDKAVLKDVDSEVLLDKAKEIYQDYLEPNGAYHVAVRPDIVAATASKIRMLETTI